jgi:hypothetical protein
LRSISALSRSSADTHNVLRQSFSLCTTSVRTLTHVSRCPDHLSTSRSWASKNQHVVCAEMKLYLGRASGYRCHDMWFAAQGPSRFSLFMKLSMGNSAREDDLFLTRGRNNIRSHKDRSRSISVEHCQAPCPCLSPPYTTEKAWNVISALSELTVTSRSSSPPPHPGSSYTGRLGNRIPWE